MIMDPFDQRHRMFMDGREVRKRAQFMLLKISNEEGGPVVSGAVHEALHKAGLAYSDIGLAVFHQANLRIVNPVVERMRKLGFVGQVHNNITWFGNTTSPSTGLCLDEAWQAGLVKEGDLVMVVTVAGGLGTAIYFFRFTLASYPSHELPISFIHLPETVALDV